MIKKKNKHLISAFLSFVIAFSSINSCVVNVFAAPPLITEEEGLKVTPPANTTPGPTTEPTKEPTKKPTKAPSKPKPTMTEDETKESIMKGLSKFEFKEFKWPKSLTVGGSAFRLAESIYTMRNNKTKKPLLWNKEDIETEMKDYYSSTAWKTMPGMMESVDSSNFCEAILTPEVEAYAELMDIAAKNCGIDVYKEIFKAIAQTRFNEHKVDYEKAKKDGYINDTADDKFDLFHINGSWIDGGCTPVEEKQGNVGNSKAFTVGESINMAALAFSHIVSNGGFPSPYSTDSLTGIVQSFEFGGSSNKTKIRFNKSPHRLPTEPGFIAFEEYHGKMTNISHNSESDVPEEEKDIDKIIERYAKVMAHGKQNNAKDTEKTGKYKYSDQKFYQKVFQNYKCSSGSIDMGNLPEEMKALLRKCMAGWGANVTKERREIIQHACSLYGVTYTLPGNPKYPNDPYRNTPSIEKPLYLDCSSFVSQAYWRAGFMTPAEVYAWTTGTFASKWKKIDEAELIPGDIAQISWNPNKGGNTEHIGIYLGEADGSHCYIHCTASLPGGGSGRDKGKGVVIQNNYSSFIHFGRCPQLN